MKIVHQLNLKEVPIVMDQALFCKAAEITWKHTDEYKPISLQMGVFHTICCMISIIGKRFRDAGLRDLAVESGAVAEGSINAVLDGKKYNLGIRLYKLVYEELLRVAWKQFLKLVDENPQQVPFLDQAIDQLKKLFDNPNQETLESIMRNDECKKMLDKYDKFLDSFRESTTNSLGRFWISFIDMTEIILGFIRGSREGNFLLNAAMIEQMIDWAYAYDHQKYARSQASHYADISRLEDEYPEIYAFFKRGGFSVQIGEYNPFGRIPIDQAIKETVNKNTQTPGGTKGFSLKKGAVSRFYITAEHRSV